MILIRSAIFNIFFFTWTFLVAVFFSPLLLTPPRIVIIAGRVWARGIVIAARIICGIKWQVEGQKNIPDGASIIAAKHQSAWETAVLYLILDMPVYVLKKELTYIPLFGWYTRAIKTIAVDRSAGAKALKNLMKQAKDRIENRRQIIIFPEGTRTKPSERRKYQPGIAAVYSACDVKVVPLALNSGICWPKNSFIKKPGTIIFKFLPAIEPGMKREEFMKLLEEKIESESEKLSLASHQKQ